MMEKIKKNIFYIYKGIVPKSAILFFENYLVFIFFPYIFVNVERMIKITYKRNFENYFGFLKLILYLSPEKKIEIIKQKKYKYYEKKFCIKRNRYERKEFYQ